MSGFLSWLLECLVVEGSNFVVMPFCGHRIFASRVAWHFPRKGAVFGDPLVAAAIHNLDFLVPKKAKCPQSVARPPIRFVTVKYDSRAFGDSVLRTELGKYVWRNIVAHGLVLEIGAPIDVHGTGNMAHAVKQDILVAFHEPSIWLVQMHRQPVNCHQRVGLGVIRIDNRSSS